MTDSVRARHPVAPSAPLVADLSEEQLLARIFPHLPRGPRTLVGPGDDAAVVTAPDGRVVVTTDVLVEDRHFRRAWSSGRDVGRRAAVQNLADVASMGAVPTSLVVALVLPGDLPAEWVEGLAQGFGEACAPHGVDVVGGDLSGGPLVVVAVTAHGDLEGRDPVLRSGARPGDVVAHAGACGTSAAGLALLEAGLADVDPAAVASFRAPTSPLAAGPLAAAAGASAMLDVSDGLLRDAGRLARASGVVVDLDDPRVALAPDLARVRTAAQRLGVDPQAWLLGGGEDHGLLATFPPDAALPAPFRRIGRVRARSPLADAEPDVLVAGEVPAVRPGWDHFAG
ncbi:thiamine-phosphate kinase [Cellulomonas fimi]|uniref:Thiamine-monophosphate kinase n=1 Tax=Cellulomonas fimi (strain ATCC 484 / DSM 20113 / JCM 1341 / CCUG 24087 / LMG 16345 / NBRC 15513 / NCIMB 8980 / NCTC 7547 / NRS-133) TaxID=590998 RepID=F4H499_CELFA|nr:thiamine-phosphate kinase [Cellulomonas fimi]AEE46575.1 thiamine-monophosphate kinase [Cellulomonas fimi ATCC 484]NNH08519.1 thiamine-phosphate kinase [Cellulomonas fimi]VEH33547.1 Thiamine-monophosphate kinase [Cellulomonas fimi]